MAANLFSGFSISNQHGAYCLLNRRPARRLAVSLSKLVFDSRYQGILSASPFALRKAVFMQV